MAPSRESLVEFLNSVVFCNLTPDFIDNNGQLPYSGPQILALLCYMTKVDVIQHDVTVARFLDIAPDFLSEYNATEEIDPALGPSSIAYDMAHKLFEAVVSFMPELQKFFSVQQLPQSAIEQSEFVAAFMDFLVQILDCKKFRWVDLTGDRIEGIKKEIRFLVFVLGDAPFRSTESKKILDQFEDVGNFAGRLVYSFYFSRYAVEPKEMDAEITLLLDRIELLKSRIRNYCVELSEMENYVASRSAGIDSLFIVDSLLDDLENLINEKSELVLDVKDQTRTLYDKLLSLKSLVKKMKLLMHTEIEELREPIVKIRDTAYEAEYVMNSFVAGEFPLWYLTLRLSNIVQKLKSIETGLEEIQKRNETGVLGYGYHFGAAASSQVKRTPLLDDFMVGFEKEENEILEKLVGGVPEYLQVITIYGMPGLGKTTLAKKLFNHPSVAYYFDGCVWAVVSQTYHKRELLIRILSSLTMIDRDAIVNMDEDSLATQIYQTLKGRRYLLIMDDVWDSVIWDELRRYFPQDGNGSRVLFTTRNKDVAPSNNAICTIPLLSEDQCWKLIEKRVFENQVCPPQLLNIGNQIAADCSGLPLTTVVIAGILANIDKEECAWKEVEERMSSYIIADQETSCMNILELSYKHLPDHLKPCFLYFGAFPEDAQVSAKRLIQLWIAEGFVRKDEIKCLESVGEDYLMELIDRSLVLVDQHKSTGGVKSCHVHDLWRDLSLIKVREENFLKWIKKDYSMYERHHRLLVSGYSKESTTSSLFYKRSLRPFGLHVRSILGRLGRMSFWFPSIKFVRILDFLIMPRDLVGELDEIGQLLHLRYLAINGNIPISIGNPVNLEFLIVEGLHIDAIVIPACLLKLEKLRHLRARDRATFGFDYDGSLVNNLLTLSFVEIMAMKDMKMLKCLPNLRQLKCECGKLFPDLRFLVQLDTLKMDFNRSFRGEYDKINFPVNIKKLTLAGLGLPWEEISTIGRLPNLEVLKLEKNSFVGKTWETSEDEFQQLKFLKLKNLQLEEWNASSEHFPVLQRVALVSCYNLMSIPTELGDIPTLQLIEVQWCNNLLKESALQIQEEQYDSGNTELRVIPNNTFSEQSELIPNVTEYFVNRLTGRNLMPELSVEDKREIFGEIFSKFNDLHPTEAENLDMEELRSFVQELEDDML